MSLADRKINIVAINGSPNRNGNTVFLLNRVLTTCAGLGAEVGLIHCQEALQGQKVPFCLHCQSPCLARCAQDTPLGEAFARIKRADGLVIGSPVYFGLVTGQLKAFWDKTRSLRAERGLINVVGGAVAVGGSQYGGQENTVRSIHEMMLTQGMLLAGDGFIDDDCGHAGVMATRPAQEDQNALKRAVILGKRMAETARATVYIRKGQG